MNANVPVTGWLSRLGEFEVEHIPIPRRTGGPIKPDFSHRMGVLHTTTGTSVSSAVSTLVGKGGAAYSMLFAQADAQHPKGRMIQLRSLLADRASSLRGGDQNRIAPVQLAMVCDPPATDKLWLPGEEILQPLLRAMAFLQRAPFNIPLACSWTPDNYNLLHGKSWAINNLQRQKAGQPGQWPNKRGWCGHCFAPNQAPTWHHCPYAFDFWTAFQMIEAYEDHYGAVAFEWDPDGPFGPLVGEHAGKPAIVARRGDHGPIVYGIQQAFLRLYQLVRQAPGGAIEFRAYSLPTFGADKGYGAEVEAATRLFQHTTGLPVTGTVDQSTFDLLTQT